MYVFIGGVASSNDVRQNVGRPVHVKQTSKFQSFTMSNWESWTITYRKTLTIWDWLFQKQPRIEIMSLKLSPRAGKSRQLPDGSCDEFEIVQLIEKLDERIKSVITRLVARKHGPWRLVALRTMEREQNHGIHEYECYITLQEELYVLD